MHMPVRPAVSRPGLLRFWLILIPLAFAGGALADDDRGRHPAMAPTPVLVSQTLGPQTTTEGRSAGDPIEEVVVTGSRIRRDGYTSDTALTAMNKEEILATGLTELSEVLLQIPSVATDIDPSNSQSNIQHAGISSIQLRDLGSNRTLTLIDGQRMVSNSASSYRIDQSTIPSALISNIEVITGGASSVYGSGAVAGVINYITEDDFEGLEFEVRAGPQPTRADGGGERQDMRIAWGGFFDDGLGYVMLAASADRRHSIQARDWPRFLIQADYDWDCEIDDPQDSCANEFRSAYPGGDLDHRPIERFTGPDADLVWPDNLSDGSSHTPGGYFDDGNFWYLEDGTFVCYLDDDDECNNDNSSENSIDEDVDAQGQWRYDGRKDRQIYIPRHRHNLSVKLDWRLSDTTKWSNLIMYSYNRSVSTREAETVNDGEGIHLLDPITGASSLSEVGEIPEGNPFIPEQADHDDIEFRTRRPEIGPQINRRKTDVYRILSALEGELSLGAQVWDWEASLSWGRTRLDNRRSNEINLINLRHGLDVEADPDNSGQYRCADEDARADGCVPVNLFGPGAMSPEAAAYVRAILQLDASVRQTTLQTFMTGPIAQLPAGDLQAVLGAEWRRDSQTSRNDQLSRFGGSTGPIVPDLDASISVAEVFGELDAPLLAGRTGAHWLGAHMSARLSDYSLDNVSMLADYNLGLTWRPTDSLLVRLRHGTANRAPDMNEAFSQERGDFDDDFEDPCDGVGQDDDSHLANPTISANCRSIPQIAEDIADPDDNFEGSPSGYSPNAGNTDVTEETATTTTLGLVWDMPGLSLALDWYDIDVDNVISAYTNSDILFQCYADADGFYNSMAGVAAPADRRINPRCLDVERDSSGQISKVVQRDFNLDGLHATGLDFNARLQFSADSLHPVIPGEMRLSYRHNHEIRREYTSELYDGTILVDRTLGETDSPKDEGRLRIAYYPNDNLRITWSIYYISSVVDDKQWLQQYREAQAIRAAAGTEPPARPLYLFFPSFVDHDLSVRWQHDLGDDLRLTLRARIYNITDRDTPFYPSARLGGSSHNYDSAWGVPLGRRFYLGATLRY